MFVKCVNKDLENKIFDFIGDDYFSCLYLYVNLKKYSFNSNVVDVFVQIENEDILSVILKYHSCIHIYNKNILMLPSLIHKVLELKPKMICSTKNNILEMEKLLNNCTCKCKSEYGYVLDCESYIYQTELLGKRVSMDQFGIISDFLYKDEVFSKSYNAVEDLKTEITERNASKYSRNFCIIKNDEIVAHISTGAELDKLAILTGFLVEYKSRNLGYGKNVLASICKDLQKEGKMVYSIVYGEKSLNLHKSVGFNLVGEIGRLKF